MKFCLLLASIVGVFGEFTKNDVQYHRIENYNDFEFIGPPRIKTTLSGRPLEIPHHLRTGEPVVINKNEALKDFRSCLMFDYYLNVPESMGLKIVHENAPGAARNFSQVVWSHYGYNGDVWRRASLDMTLKKGESLLFTGTTDSGSIAFSDVLIDKNNQQCKYSAVNTDFEAQPLENLWANADVRSARDILPSLKDHTSGSGFGKVAHLKQASNSRVTAKNPVAKDTKCFTFWYQRPVDKDGQSLTQFAVYANGKEVWRVNDASAPEGEWLRAIVPLNFEKDGNIISLDVDVNGKEKQTGVLLDDFHFSEYQCPEPVACLFYNDNCGWTNMVFSAHGHTWSFGEGRVQDVTPFGKELVIPKTSPISLLYTDFTEQRPSSGIEVQSDFFAGKGEHCLLLEFSHSRVQANDLFTLNHKYQSSGAIKSDVLWTFDSATAAAKFRENGGVHKEIARIDIPAQEEARRVSLFARSANPLTRISINKIEVFHRSCNPSTATTPKPATTPRPADFVPSKLDKTTLTIADELLKNSKANVERILDLIKVEDPIKTASQKVMTEIDAAIQEVGHNLK